MLVLRSDRTTKSNPRDDGKDRRLHREVQRYDTKCVSQHLTMIPALSSKMMLRASRQALAGVRTVQ
jgi:hypothetical protein